MAPNERELSNLLTLSILFEGSFARSGDAQLPHEKIKTGRRNRTSDGGLQYRCGQVGRGIQSYKPIPHTPSTYTQPYYLKRAFSHLSTLSSPTHGPMNQQTDGPTNIQSLLLSRQSATKKNNKAGYTATPVACRWAGAIFEVT